MTDNRKCTFYIYPDRNAADRVTDGLLDKLPQKERGRAMRAMMLCGAALMKQDERLPFLIAEFMTKDTSMDDIQRIINSTLPQSNENEKVTRLVESFLLATRKNNTPDFRDEKSDNCDVSEHDNEVETRRNSQQMFPDTD
ncbi:plasmid partitioning/stability family protein [Serratia ureilytica]|uniref:plasmid partitioning/stability family protein n=1 Tax=Serratia ureilytica TaxID=300181 RepID=UPI001AA18371|nr:plasmid partitioning/stability family protein [Serratia ureilytica]MBO1811616.1 plasmid partitioning/stability family protein [Serratia ureilytica]